MPYDTQKISGGFFSGIINWGSSIGLVVVLSFWLQKIRHPDARCQAAWWLNGNVRRVESLFQPLPKIKG